MAPKLRPGQGSSRYGDQDDCAHSCWLATSDAAGQSVSATLRGLVHGMAARHLDYCRCPHEVVSGPGLLLDIHSPHRREAERLFAQVADSRDISRLE